MKNTLVENFFFVGTKEKSFDKYQMVPELTLSFMISGKKELRFADAVIQGSASNIGLIRKNALLKSIQMLDEHGQDYESISIFFTPDIIRSYMAKKALQSEKKYIGPAYMDLSKAEFLQAYFHSLLPYFQQPNKLTPELATIKTNEAIELLLEFNPEINKFLFDLSEPHKIDLEKYMNTNYIFNVPIKEFARLTGRSLSTFKRDFKTIYNTTPEKWLKERRLEEARLLITEKRQKPSEVYYQVGFESLSHFSTAFKNHFGAPPSKFAE